MKEEIQETVRAIMARTWLERYLPPEGASHVEHINIVKQVETPLNQRVDKVVDVCVVMQPTGSPDFVDSGGVCRT